MPINSGQPGRVPHHLPHRAQTEEGGSVDLEELAHDRIARMIDARFKGHGLARLVESILQAQDYITRWSGGSRRSVRASRRPARRSWHAAASGIARSRSTTQRRVSSSCSSAARRPLRSQRPGPHPWVRRVTIYASGRQHRGDSGGSSAAAPC